MSRAGTPRVIVREGGDDLQSRFDRVKIAIEEMSKHEEVRLRPGWTDQGRQCGFVLNDVAGPSCQYPENTPPKRFTNL